jgi:transcriptional regulator with XRE-family HTH domain
MTAAFNFTRKTLPQREGLGERLTKKRIALGYDIRDVEKAIRIRAKYIEAIENGNYDKLPPEVYVKGFIKTYAEYLKLDPNKVQRAYEKERGMIENLKKVANKAPVVKTIDAPKIVITPKTIIFGGISALALIIILYISWQVRILTAPPRLNISSPNDNITLDADSLYIEGQTDSGASLYINEVPVGVDQNGGFKEKISLQNGVNILKIRSVNKLGKKNELTRTIVANIKNIDSSQQAATGMELKLDIGPKSASILVEVDGKRVTDKAMVMVAGVSQTYKGNDKITITTNNAGSVRATYNGQDIGVLGKDGEQVKRDFIKGMQIK